MAYKPKNPRIHLTLSVELMETLDELSALTGAARSSFPSELLESNLPMFRELVKILRIAHTNPVETSEKLSDMLTATLLAAGQMKMQVDNQKPKRLRKKRT